MVRISLAARLALALVATLGLLVYVAIVDLGVNAGLVHRGVQVGHVDVGGLSRLEAAARIADAGEAMRNTPIRLAIEGVGSAFVYPRDLGWKPHAERKAAEAMAIGRTGGVLAGTRQRLSAWFGGTRIGWDPPRTAPLRREIRSLIRAARTAGVELGWGRVRATLIEATYDWPRDEVFEL